MSPRIRTLLLAAVAIAMAVLYTARLNQVPSFLSSDETAFALQAHAIATTAHDTNGRLLPLYFQMMQNVWFHPALVYLMAPLLIVLRPLPWVVRSPVAIVALCNILLVFVVARRLGASDAAAIGASVILGLTPAHLLHGRFACDYLLPVPCVLVWFILLIDANKSSGSWRYFAAGGVLGLGLSTYIAAVVMMPVCLGLTYLTLLLSGERRVRPYAAVTAGFILLVLPLASYLLAVPEVYAGFTERYGGANLDVVHHPGGLFYLPVMAQRWATYRSFFEPSFLFDRAETHVMSSTYTTGVFLKAMKVLIPIGVYHILVNRRTRFTLLLLATFLAAPIAASLIPEPHAIDRALLLLPTAALIAAFGVDWLLVTRVSLVTWTTRAACAALFVWMAVQFDGFYRDYMTDYPIRASSWFDGNHPGAFEPLVRQHPRDDRRLIYLSSGLPRIREHWEAVSTRPRAKRSARPNRLFHPGLRTRRRRAWQPAPHRHRRPGRACLYEDGRGAGGHSHHRTGWRARLHHIRTNAGSVVLSLRRNLFGSSQPHVRGRQFAPRLCTSADHGGVPVDGDTDGGQQPGLRSVRISDSDRDYRRRAFRRYLDQSGPSRHRPVCDDRDVSVVRERRV